MKQIAAQAIRFGIIGIAATATHFVVALTLIYGSAPPLWANGIAFLVAFQISFFGHLSYTFASQEINMMTSMRRFAVTAICGFLLSETLLATFLAFTNLAAPVALTLTLLLVAGLTFLVSRHWAFGGVRCN